MANEAGTWQPEFEISVKIADGQPEVIATGKLDLPIVFKDDKSPDLAVSGVMPALLEAFEFIVENLKKEVKPSA